MAGRAGFALGRGAKLLACLLVAALLQAVTSPSRLAAGPFSRHGWRERSRGRSSPSPTCAACRRAASTSSRRIGRPWGNRRACGHGACGLHRTGQAPGGLPLADGRRGGAPAGRCLGAKLTRPCCMRTGSTRQARLCIRHCSPIRASRPLLAVQRDGEGPVVCKACPPASMQCTLHSVTRCPASAVGRACSTRPRGVDLVTT